MKTFFTVFFAILAAAVVIFVALSAKARLDQWEQSKRMCYAQFAAIASSSEGTVDRMKGRIAGLESPLEVARWGMGTLSSLQADQKRMLNVEQTLVAILEQKPFGLPLTADERKELNSAKAAAKAAIKKNIEYDYEIAAAMKSATASPYPSPAESTGPNLVAIRPL
jgi:hypothetical protein